MMVNIRHFTFSFQIKHLDVGNLFECIFTVHVCSMQYHIQWNVRYSSIILLSKQLHEPRAMGELNNRPDQPHDYAGRRLLQHGTLLRLFRGRFRILFDLPYCSSNL